MRQRYIHENMMWMLYEDTATPFIEIRNATQHATKYNNGKSYRIHKHRIIKLDGRRTDLMIVLLTTIRFGISFLIPICPSLNVSMIFKKTSICVEISVLGTNHLNR